MDVSKLPRMSQTPAPPPPQPDPYDAAAPPPFEIRTPLAEAWVSLAIGVILLLMVPTTLQYFSSKIFHTNFAPFPDPTQPPPAKCDFIMFSDGTKVFYPQMMQFWSDLAMTGFAVVLVFDGLVLLFARNRALVGIAFGLTVLATAGNLIYVIATYSQGLAIMSAMAVVFGVYIALSQWRMLQLLGLLQRSSR